MESATFVSKADNRAKLGEGVRMVMLKDKFVVDAGLPLLFVASRRSYYFNRRPTVVSGLTRRGLKDDVECEFEVSNLFSTFESDVALAVGRQGENALLELKTSAEGVTKLHKTVGSPLPSEVVAAAFIGSTLETVALLSNGAVVRLSADLKTVTDLRKETAVKSSSFIAVHDDFVLVPASDAIDIISLSTKKSALTSPWVPHSQATEPIIAAHIFRTWKQSANAPNTNVVMTVGAGGREVRLWTGLGNAGGLELAAHLTLEGLPTREEAAKRVTVTDNEETVLITFGTVVMVLTTDERRVCFSRATEWEAQQSSGPFCCYVEVTKAGTCQNVMVTRSDDCVTSVKLPPSVFGPTNIGAAALALTGAAGTTSLAASAASPNSHSAASATATTAVHERETKYFAAAVHKDASPAVIVSSSLNPTIGGGCGAVDGGAAEKAASAAIATVAADATQRVLAVRGDVVATHAAVSGLISTLQAQATQAAAAKQGKDHATRNATRFSSANSNTSAAATSPSGAATATGKNVDQLMIVCDAMRGAVQNAIVTRASTDIAPKVRAAVDAADNSSADVVDLPKLTSIPQTQAFNTNIDRALKAQNDYMKTEADNRAASYNAQIVRSNTTTRQTIAESRRFLESLRSELAGLTTDIESVKVELESSSTANRNTIGAVSSVNAVEEAVALVEKKNYAAAVTTITQAKDYTLLLEFVGHPTVKVAMDNGAFAPGAISAPAFGMLIQQLADDVHAVKGHIAPRVAFMCTLCVDWDDFIDGADAGAKSLLATLAPSMAVARRSVEGLSKDDMSIETRRLARTVGRVLGKIE